MLPLDHCDLHSSVDQPIKYEVVTAYGGFKAEARNQGLHLQHCAEKLLRWLAGRHPGGKLMSQVGGGKTGNRLRWSIPLYW